MYFLIRLTSALQTSATVLTFIIIDKIAGRTNMAAQVSLAIIIVLMNLEYTTGGNLWCYQCNTDLTNGHTRECNDPYVPTPYFDLVLCPQNESQNCLKSVIDYGHILVTVRGCVPSREIDGYCQLEEYFQGSSIACYFCEGYACNNQNSTRVFLLHNLAFLLASIAIMLYL